MSKIEENYLNYIKSLEEYKEIADKMLHQQRQLNKIYSDHIEFLENKIAELTSISEKTIETAKQLLNS
jgi:hypothetical protein